MSDDRIEKLSAQLDAANSKIRALANKKDAAVAKFRADLLEMNRERDLVAAELSAARKVAGLTTEEREALATELAGSTN